MKIYNVATDATADVPDESVAAWATVGWVPVVPEPEVEEDAEDAAEETAEKTAASGRGRHPTAKANKDT